MSGLGSAQGAGNSRYRGEQLGLPETGVGSAAAMSRRLAALLVDWVIAAGLALLIVRGNTAVEGPWSTTQWMVWFVVGVVSVRLWRFTPGQYMAGIQVAPADGTNSVGIGRAFVRNLLITLIVPPLITDEDGRGLHDRVTRTVTVRSR